MTTTGTLNTPERQRRISALWSRRDNLTYAEVEAIVDAELADEAAERAEVERKTKETTDAMHRFWTCNCCGVGGSIFAQDGLCHDCRPVVAQLEAERRARDMINGRPRRAWAEALLERRGRKAS